MIERARCTHKHPPTHYGETDRERFEIGKKRRRLSPLTVGIYAFPNLGKCLPVRRVIHETQSPTGHMAKKTERDLK